VNATIDQVVAAIRASISSQKNRNALEAKIARLIASAAKAALAPKRTTISSHEQAASAGPGVYRVKEAKGLYFKKGTSGCGSWFCRFRLGGRRPEMGLGALDEVSLAEAKAKLVDIMPQIKSGVNPITARRDGKTEIARKEALTANKRTFTQATEDYLKAHASSWKHPASLRLWRNPVEKYAYPVIGHKLLDEIGVEDIVAIMDATVAQNAPTAGPRVRLRVEQVINAAIALGQRNASLGNPAATKLIKAVRPTAGSADEHFRRISLDDAPVIFSALKERAVDSTAFAAWVWTIATISRPGEEALKAEWSEINLAKATWTVPAARMKGKKGVTKDRVVPLSSIALWALTQQERRRTGDALFPGLSGSPLSYTAFSRAPKKAGIDAGSPHSWRSIWRDAAEDRLGIAPQTAEAALAYSLGKVERAYRRETGIEAQAVAMQRYADWLMGENNVVPFPLRAAAAE
jgi:integrase